MNRLNNPEWRFGDTIRSLRDLGRQAITGLCEAVDAAMDCFGDEDKEAGDE